MKIEAGMRLGPYQVVESLGAGGMGEVYKALDTRLDRTVAIKVLGGHLASNADLRQRFEREAKTISSLSHPHICTLYDIGQHEGTDYLVMEYLEGDTLADLLAKGPLPVEQVLAFGVQIAQALDKAHKQGVVHRDIKPGNIMITRSGVKLLDFGLAKYQKSAAANDGLSAMATAQKPLTQEGTIVGTFQYMAPEQLEGVEADPRTDIFSFGAVLYEMATGRRAFEGKTRTSLIAAIVSSNPPPISELQPVTPPAFERVVRVCLRKDPEDRWQTAHDVMLELQWISEAGSQAGVAAPLVARRRSRERLAWSLVAILAIIAAIASWTAWRELTEPERVYRFNIVPPKGVEPVFTDESATCLTISPDGSRITFAARDEDGKTVLWLRRLDQTEPVAVDGSIDPTSPFWSPDSRHVAFFSGGKLKKASVTGTPPLNLCDVQTNPRAGSWNEDGVIIFSPASLSVVHRIPAAGGTPEPLTELDESKVETTHRWATFLRDGNHFLFMAGSHATGAQAEGNAIYVSSLEEPKVRKLILRARSNAFHSKGHLLYVRDNVLVAQKFDEKKLDLVGDPFPVVDGVTYAAGFFRGLFSVAENGMLVYYPGSADVPLSMVRLDREGRKSAEVGDPAFFNSFQPSPDGRRIAMSIADRSTGYSDIWIHDLERNVRSRFTFGPLDEDFPIWSPDGQELYFSMREDVLPDIFRKRLAGTAREEPVVKGPGWKGPFDISADGKRLAFVVVDVSAGQNVDTMTVDLASGGEPEPFLTAQYDEFGGYFSPDGSKVLYGTNETGRQEVYVATFPEPERRWQISSSGGSFIGWTKEGKEILFQSTDGEVNSVTVTEVDGDLQLGAPVALFSASRYQGLSVTKDGNLFFATERPQDTGTDTITFISDWMAVSRPESR